MIVLNNYSEHNWAGCNEKPINGILWSILLSYIINDPNIPRPFHVGVCGDGTIHIEWRKKDNKFLIEMGINNFDFSYTLNNKTIYSSCDNIEYVLTLLKNIIRC